MKKRAYISIVLSICLLLSLTGYAFAAGFSDLQGHWAEAQINKWAASGLASGYSDGTFQPNKGVSRAEFVALVNRAFGIRNTGADVQFKDVQAGQWFYGEVAAAKSAGYIGGYNDGTFRPNQTISRQEVASILVRLLKLDVNAAAVGKFADAAQIQAWAKGSVGAVVQNGLMGGFPDNTFKPLQNITRAEAVVTLDRALSGKPVVTDTGISGTVTLNGAAVSNATVRIFEADSYQVVKEIKTASNGTYKVDLAAGNYDITAVTSGEVGFKSDVKVEQGKYTSVGITLEKAAVLSGTLEDKNGKLVKNTTMFFTTNPTFVTTTDDSGKFTIAVVPNRTYTVRAYNPDKKDEEPVIVNSSLEVGAAGEQKLDTLKAPFSLTSSAGGGGGSSGGSSVSTPDPAELNTAGTYNKDYTIAKSDTFGPASGISIVNGTLTVNPGADGKVTLQNIQATSIVVKSGASSSIHLNGVKATSLTVDAGNQANSVRIVTEGNTSITTTSIKSKVILQASSGTFGNVTVEAAAAGKSIKLEGTFNGTFTVAAGANDVFLTIAPDTIISKLILLANVSLNGDTAGIVERIVGDGVVVGGGVIPADHTLPALLDAIQAAFNGLSDEEWNNLKAQRDELISNLTEDQIINALRDAGFESLVNSNLTEAEARTTLGIVRSLAYLGRDNVSSSLGLISDKINELKAIYSDEVARLADEGVTQEAVYDYVIDLYDAILAGDYTVRKDGNYEVDLYNAALAELRNGQHEALCNAIHKAYDRVVASYTADPTYGDVIAALAPEFDDLTGSDIVAAKAALELIKPNVSSLFDTFDFLLDLSKTFLPN